LNHRDYVLPEDIHALAVDVLRHRLVLSFSAKADGLTEAAVINRLLETLPTV
jgi:MoxR-like ATPase